MLSERIGKTYYAILCEMSGFEYNAPSSTKALANECRKYLLDELNFQVEEGKINDPIFGCSVKAFHGIHLSWNKTTWRKSAQIVYQYFKASTLIKKIKEYEIVFARTIVFDYNELLEFVYHAISKGQEIEWSKAASLGKDFNLVPLKVLEDKLNLFKELYE